MRSATAIVTSPSHNQGSHITWCAGITDPPLPQPPYHPQGGLIGMYMSTSLVVIPGGSPLPILERFTVLSDATNP